MNNKNSLEHYITKNELPHSIEHESAVSSALIRDKTVIELLTERGVDEEYFHSPTMQSVYLACKDLVDQAKDINILSVKAYLKQNHSEENVLNTLIELSEIDVLTFQILSHIDRLIEYKQRRDQAQQAVELFDEAYNGRFVVERQEDILSYLESWKHIKDMDVNVEYIVDRNIPKESINVIFGPGGIGKTWLVLDIARCVSCGIPWLGFETIKAPVIFIDFENSLAVLNERVNKLGDTDNVYFWRSGNDKMKPPKLDSKKDWEQYKKLPEGAVLIFDTLRASQSRDENASNEMGRIMNRLKEIRDMGFTIILLHHTAKSSDSVAKGSTAIVDLADHIIGLTRIKKKKDGQEIVVDDDYSDEDTLFRFGVRGKTRFEPFHIYLALNPDRGFELAPDPQEETLKAMHGILEEQGTINKTTFIEACQGLGISKNKLRKLINIGQGRYWTIERHKEQKNAMLVTAKNQFSSFPTIYKGEKLNNCQESLENISI